MKPEVNHDSSQLKTPRARRKRSRVFRIMLFFAIALILVGAVSTIVRIWNNKHKTDTHNVTNQEVEESVLAGIKTKKLHDLSPEKPVEIVKESVSLGKSGKKDAEYEDIGVSLTKIQKGNSGIKLSKEYKSSDMMAAVVTITNTSKKDMAYEDMVPILILNGESKVKVTKKNSDGDVVEPGYSVQGVPYFDKKPVSMAENKKCKSGKSFSLTYLFDMKEYKKSKQKKTLQVYGKSSNGSHVLFREFSIKE